MDKDKWLHIYSNIQRMNFYAYLEGYEPEVLASFNQRFSSFLNKSLNTNQYLNHVRFFGGDFLISFAYQTLVRVFEFLRSQKEIQMEEFFSEIEVNFNFYSLLETPDLDIRVPEKDKLYKNGFKKFIRKLRNAISHSRFDNPDYYSIRLFNIKDDGQKNFEVIFQYDAFLNFCIDFGFEVNEELIRRGFFETK